MNELRICKYKLCKTKEFISNRKGKVFCCRNCKNKNRKYIVYHQNKGGGQK